MAVPTVSRGYAIFAGVAAWLAAALHVTRVVGGIQVDRLASGMDNVEAHVHVYETGQGSAYQLFHWGWGGAAVVMPAVVVAVALVLGLRRAWVLWSGVLALIGLAVTAANHMRAAVTERDLVANYLAADESTRAAIAAVFDLLNPIRTSPSRRSRSRCG